MINFKIQVKRVESCLIIGHIINTMSLFMPTALILNIKREVIIPAILYTCLCFVRVCGGQGEGHPSAWVNVSMPQSLANGSCLPNCTNEWRPRSRTACQADWSGWFASLHATRFMLRANGCITAQMGTCWRNRVVFLKNVISVQGAKWMFFFNLQSSESRVKLHNEADLLT